MVRVGYPSSAPVTRPDLTPTGPGQLAGEPRHSIKYREARGQDKDKVTGTVTQGDKEEDKTQWTEMNFKDRAEPAAIL